MSSSKTPQLKKKSSLQMLIFSIVFQKFWSNFMQEVSAASVPYSKTGRMRVTLWVWPLSVAKGIFPFNPLFSPEYHLLVRGTLRWVSIIYDLKVMTAKSYVEAKTQMRCLLVCFPTPCFFKQSWKSKTDGMFVDMKFTSAKSNAIQIDPSSRATTNIVLKISQRLAESGKTQRF